MKLQLHTQRKGGFTLIELMVVIAILAALAGIGMPAILSHMKDGDRQAASSNLQSVAKMLIQFKTDYGSYPCDATAESLTADEATANFDFGALTGTTANAYYRQLFYNKSTQEKIFYAKVDGCPKEGDAKIAGGKALEKGENAMAYIMKKTKQGEDGGRKPVSASNAPIAMCCVAGGRQPYPGDGIVIDYASLDGHAYVAYTDGSVKDIEKMVVEDDNDDSKGAIKGTIFPETRSGRDTTTDYVVLPPEL